MSGCGNRTMEETETEWEERRGRQAKKVEERKAQERQAKERMTDGDTNWQAFDR
jgi:hypothetical protein